MKNRFYAIKYKQHYLIDIRENDDGDMGPYLSAPVTKENKAGIADAWLFRTPEAAYQVIEKFGDDWNHRDNNPRNFDDIYLQAEVVPVRVHVVDNKVVAYMEDTFDGNPKIIYYAIIKENADSSPDLPYVVLSVDLDIADATKKMEAYKHMKGVHLVHIARDIDFCPNLEGKLRPLYSCFFDIVGTTTRSVDANGTETISHLN